MKKTIVAGLLALTPAFAFAAGGGAHMDHAPRGARVARSRIGESWLVLVAPYDPDSVPGRYLEEHGEGFFLLSLAVDELDETRAGILDWRVRDLGEVHGANLQLTLRPD